MSTPHMLAEILLLCIVSMHLINACMHLDFECLHLKSKTLYKAYVVVEQNHLWL